MIYYTATQPGNIIMPKVYDIYALGNEGISKEISAVTQDALTSAAGAWNGLDKKDLSPEKLNQQAEKIALGAADDSKNMLHDFAPPALIKTYIKDLVARSQELDKEKPLPGGKTHLVAYLDAIGAATPMG